MPSYSFTKLSTFAQCRYKYKLSYIDRVPADIQTTIEMFMGGKVHETLEKLNRELMDKNIIPLAELLDYYNTLWKAEIEDNILINEEGMTPEDYRARGQNFLSGYYNKYYPFNKMQVVAVETKAYIRLPNGFSYHIRIDNLARTGTTYYICDYKTNKNMKTQEEADKDTQLALYSIWVKEHYKDAEKIILLWYMLAHNEEVISERTPKSLEELLSSTVENIREIETCKEYPVHVSPLCYYCNYQKICPSFKGDETLFKLLTLSRYRKARQCRKLFWLDIFGADDYTPLLEEAEIRDELLFARMKDEMDGYLREYIGQGPIVKEDNFNIYNAVNATVRYIGEGNKILYNAAAQKESLIGRASVLKRSSKNEDAWDLYKFKWSPSFDENAVKDIAFQSYCFVQAGYKIDRSLLIHTNKDFKRNGKIEPAKLLVIEDVSKKVEEYEKALAMEVNGLLELMGTDKCPDVDIGTYCGKHLSPGCPFFNYCHEPHEKYSITELSAGNYIALHKAGIKYIKDIPEDFKVDQLLKNLVISNKTREPYIDKPEIRKYLKTLEYPLYYFDFEALYNYPAPPFDNCRPYRQIPFQFSLHIQKEKNGPLSAHSFLLKEKKDPLEDLIRKMLELLGTSGSIVAYNASYEKTCINNLAESYPKYSKELNLLLKRFNDLMAPFKSGYYVHYLSHGSYSLKNILPALCPDYSYEDLEIREGGTASNMYAYWINNLMDVQEWEKTYHNLIEYCGLDTLSMAKIIGALYKAAG